MQDFEDKLNALIDEYCKDNRPGKSSHHDDLSDYYLRQHVVCTTILEWLANYFYRDFDESLMDESISQNRARNSFEIVKKKIKQRYREND